MAPRGLVASPPPYSIVIVPSLPPILPQKHRAGGRLWKQKSPWTTQIKDEKLLLIKHSWNHSYMQGKVSECERLYRACPWGLIILSNIRFPRSMKQKEKCLENKQLICLLG